MPAPTRTTVGLAAALLLAAPALGACGAGKTALTATQRAAIDGAQADAGDLQLRNVYLEAPSGDSWASGSEVALALYVVNRSGTPDQLVAVEGARLGTAALTPFPMQVPAGGRLATGKAHTQGATISPTVLLTTTSVLRPGQSVAMKFTFMRAGVVTLNVPVATH